MRITIHLSPRAHFAARACVAVGPILAVLGTTGAYAQRPPAGARISFTTTRRDLGRVKAGAGTTLSFPFRNSGTGTLEILGVEGDCGCVTPKYPKSVATGKSAEIAGLFEAQPSWGGKMERSLRVRTNDPSQPEIKLAIAVYIVPFVRMEPRSPLQILYQPGKVYQKSIKLTPREGSQLGLSNPTTNSSSVKAKLDPPKPGDPTRAYTLHLTVGPRKQPGDFSATVKVQTTEPNLPEAWLAVTGLAETGPVVNPSQIMLATVPPGAPDREVARLQVFTRRGMIKLLSVDTGTPALRAERIDKTPGYFYEVALRTTAQWRSGVVSSTIKVRTNDPKMPTVTVPFHATAQ